MEQAPDYFTHESVYVDEPCQIGKGTKIWHFSHVMADSIIGENCNIGQNVVISPNCIIGNNVKIQNNVSVYTGVVLEDDVFCGPSMVFTNVINPRSHVERKSEYQKTLVKQGASIGANATVVCGSTLGRYCFIGAGAVVTRDIPDYAVVYGNPARLQGWVCDCGIKLELSTLSDSCEATRCSACNRSYQKKGLDVRECDSAITETTMESQIKVPLLDLKAQYASLKTEIAEAINEVCESQRFIMGPKVAELEQQIAEYSQCSHGIGVSSGSDALLVALMALDIGSGSEVITTPYTFFATGGAVSRVGARPVFCDIDPTTYNLSPEAVVEFIAKQCTLRDNRLINNRTGDVIKAIIPVHLYGMTADMEPLMEIARKNHLKVIEDAAQAIGSEDSNGRRAGSIADIGCFSFFPSKNLGAFGDAGMCTSNNPELAEKLKILRAHGGKPKYYHSLIGGNFRIDALQAAVLSVKLNYLDSWTAQRQENARYYDEAFAQPEFAGKVSTPANPSGLSPYLQSICDSR